MECKKVDGYVLKKAEFDSSFEKIVMVFENIDTMSNWIYENIPINKKTIKNAKDVKSEINSDERRIFLSINRQEEWGDYIVERTQIIK